MQPLSNIRFGSVTPVRVRVVDPRGPRDIPPTGDAQEADYVQDMCEALSRLDVFGGNYRQSPENQTRLQEQLAKLDPDYQAGEDVWMGANFPDWRPDMLGEAERAPESHETFLLITGIRDKLAYERLINKVDEAFRQADTDDNPAAKPAEALEAINQWVRQRISEGNRQPITLEGLATQVGGVSTALLTRIFQQDDKNA